MSSGAAVDTLAVAPYTASMRFCKWCGQEKSLEQFHKCKTGRAGRTTKCKKCMHKAMRARVAKNPEKAKAYKNAYNLKSRLKMLAAYGGRCSCCGEAEPKFLELDHVNGGGLAHRRTKNGKSTTPIHELLKREGFPQDGRFQLLCGNCHNAKSFYGVCPHAEPGALPIDYPRKDIDVPEWAN